MYSGHFIATRMKDWDAPENRQVYGLPALHFQFPQSDHAIFWCLFKQR